MEDTTATTTEPVESESQPESDSQPALSDPGKKALAEERRRAAQAEKTAKALQAKLDALEAEKLSKEEKAVKEAAEAAERALKAESEALRWRIAAKYGIMSIPTLLLFLFAQKYFLQSLNITSGLKG